MGNTLAFILDPGPWKDWTLNRTQTHGTRRPGMHINNDYRHLSPRVWFSFWACCTNVWQISVFFFLYCISLIFWSKNLGQLGWIDFFICKAKPQTLILISKIPLSRFLSKTKSRTNAIYWAWSYRPSALASVYFPFKSNLYFIFSLTCCLSFWFILFWIFYARTRTSDRLRTSLR